MIMQHLSIGIFGDTEFLKKMGKKGTSNDILIHNHASSEGVFIYASPASSEKIQSLLQVINMIDVPVVVADDITREIGEQLIALETFGFKKGFVISSSNDLRKMIKGTSLENYEWVADEKELLLKLKSISPEPLTSDAWAPVDNYFNVKSVGTVALSIVKGGTIKKYDKLRVEPLGKEILVKGLQCQDKDMEEVSHGMRAGINMKGVDAEDLKRGYVVCKSAIVTNNVKVNFKKSRYAKEDLKKDDQVFFSAGLQVVVGKVDNIEKMELSFEQPLVYILGQKCMIALTSQNMPRILGSGFIV
jgi:selenocysteine-specific translation elongation factor